ncbi:MAG: DUF177 domain-containing protein [Candidatus Eiseniibacteriota bacterium]|jgi:uncharacterized protein
MNRQSDSGIILDIASLGEGVEQRSIEVAPAALDLEWPGTRFEHPFTVALEIVRMGDNLQIDGRFRGRIDATCDRCLRTVETTVSGSLRVLGRRGDASTHELGDQDGVLFHEGHQLDLTGEVRQAILLELPMRHLCSASCRGLCPHCGIDLNQEQCDCAEQVIDPRWQALAARRPVRRTPDDG